MNFTHDRRRGQDLGGIGMIPTPLEWLGPDFTLPDRNGRPVLLGDCRGKIVLINFWATWCDACCNELPLLEALYEALEREQEAFSLLAINLGESSRRVERFCRSCRLRFPVLLDRTGRVGEAYGALALPASYILDREGRVLGRATGARDWGSKTTIDLIGNLLEMSK